MGHFVLGCLVTLCSLSVGPAALQGIHDDVQRAMLPELLADLYLQSDYYVHVEITTSTSKISSAYGFTTDSISQYLASNPRFERAASLLATLQPEERDAVLREHLSAALRRYDVLFQQQVLDRVDVSPPMPTTPLDPSLGTWNSADGGPTLYCLRLGIFALLRLAADLNARAVYPDILALCERSQAQRNRLMERLHLAPQEYTRAAEVSLYEPIALSAALKHTAPPHNGIHAAWAEIGGKVLAQVSQLLKANEPLPPVETLPRLPMISDVQFDALLAAATAK